MAKTSTTEDTAPTFNVPGGRIVSIQHPCIIKNFHNGFKSLGGEQQIMHVLDHEVGESRDLDVKNGAEPSVGLSLRPNDPFAKKISSTAMRTGNVLIKVTLPRRTGRKRKRGCDDPYKELGEPHEATTTSISTPDLLRRMRDNTERYRVEAVGMITDSHHFRTLPDFQIRTDDAPIMRELRDHIMVPDYDRLKAFSINIQPERGEHPTFPGPPNFIPTAQSRPPPPKPRNQQPTTTTNDGLTTTSKTKTPQLRDIAINPDIPQVPQGPAPSLAPPDPTRIVSTVVAKLKESLEDRPIMTRLYYGALLPHRDNDIRRALPHVAYYFDGGPWRWSIVRHGVDPRTDPKFRIYQTVNFSRAACAAIKSGSAYGVPPKTLRTFDGTTVVDPGETWQVCDFTDPLIAQIVQTDDIRATYDPRWGWYHNGTMAKVLVLVRAKMLQLANPTKAAFQLTDAEYDVLARLPDRVAKASECYLDGRVHGGTVARLAEAIGDEAVSPTYLGVRGYEEVIPVDPGPVPAVESLDDHEGGDVEGEGGAEEDGDDGDDGGSDGWGGPNAVAGTPGDEVEEGAVDGDTPFSSARTGDALGGPYWL